MNYKGMEGTYTIKEYIEVQCICGSYVVFRKDDNLVNATMCNKCKCVVLRSTIEKQKNA